MIGLMYACCCLFLLAVCSPVIGADRIDVKPADFQVYTVPDANGRARPARLTDPLILQLTITGAGRQDLYRVKQTIYQLDNTFLKNSKICAILLQVDIWGGGDSAFKIFHEIKAYSDKKQIPVFAYCNGRLSGGANIVCCAAEKIYAIYGASVGGIGKLDRYYNLRNNPDLYASDLDGRLVEVDNPEIAAITQGKHRGAGHALLEWKLDEFDSINITMDQSYEMTLDTILRHRPSTSRETLVDMGSALMLGETAQSIGLIDVANATRAEALSDLAERANCGPRFKVIELFER